MEGIVYRSVKDNMSTFGKLVVTLMTNTKYVSLPTQVLIRTTSCQLLSIVEYHTLFREYPKITTTKIYFDKLKPMEKIITNPNSTKLKTTGDRFVCT